MTCRPCGQDVKRVRVTRPASRVTADPTRVPSAIPKTATTAFAISWAASGPPFTRSERPSRLSAPGTRSQNAGRVVTAAGGPATGVDDAGWANRVRGAATDPAVIAAVTELGVEPVRGTSDPNPTFAVAYVYRLQELTTSRRIADVKARLQRTNPVDQALDYNRMFGELVMLEQHRRKLREGAVGPPGGQP